MNRPGSEINDRTAEQLQYRTSTVQHLYASAAAAAVCCGDAAARRGWYVAGAHALDQIGRTFAGG